MSRRAKGSHGLSSVILAQFLAHLRFIRFLEETQVVLLRCDMPRWRHRRSRLLPIMFLRRATPTLVNAATKQAALDLGTHGRRQESIPQSRRGRIDKRSQFVEYILALTACWLDRRLLFIDRKAFLSGQTPILLSR
eukprot:CAMPEP_0115571888 /NCGR_PEP_ID=MMETSP0272-20121206/186_1 /TAXON_ID=71861 /ORGANISM="Scrippsiella trochoidea, Strain CCMP3099" /LENGTH=135 /DNA_ID=CAMNT_0003006477 /DNA_START=723 /DNA_END=1130 /DNA_ORIENTATION=+